ncbi:MAG: DsrE family protein [Pseudomonadota bacterium]|nr:DsrE family protein [Pseudomonadota bacterium]
MQRRWFFKALAAGGAGLAMLTRTAPARAADPDKVVYHLADLDKVGFVLGNIANHIHGVGGADKVKIALVVHGPALRAFLTSAAAGEVAQAQAGLKGEGVEFDACANTMKAMKVTLADLLPGFVAAERGGVVRLAELQGQGYIYLRP